MDHIANARVVNKGVALLLVSENLDLKADVKLGFGFLGG